jgi:hypothetical protein
LAGEHRRCQRNHKENIDQCAGVARPQRRSAQSEKGCVVDRIDPIVIEFDFLCTSLAYLVEHSGNAPAFIS